MSETVDFRKTKKLSDIEKILGERLGMTKTLRRRMAHIIKKIDSNDRLFDVKRLIDILKQSETEKNLKHTQTEQANSFKYPNYYDDVRMSYTLFLQRPEHNAMETLGLSFDEMTSKEWTDYLSTRFNYPRNIAKKVGHSMYHFLNIENINANNKGLLNVIEKYPLHPLYESDE